VKIGEIRPSSWRIGRGSLFFQKNFRKIPLVQQLNPYALNSRLNNGFGLNLTYFQGSPFGLFVGRKSHHTPFFGRKKSALWTTISLMHEIWYVDGDSIALHSCKFSDLKSILYPFSVTRFIFGVISSLRFSNNSSKSKINSKFVIYGQN
jgi:hypothetical protein